MENLLDKFINNEKRSRLWAAISLFAFCAVGTTIVAVAYNIKKGSVSEQPGNEIITRIDTFIVSKEDPATALMINNQTEMIRTLTDSINDLRVRYEDRVNEVNKYYELLRECQNKPGGGDPLPPPPVEQPVKVMIFLGNMTYRIPDTSVEKLKNFISKRDNTKAGMRIGSEGTKNGKKPCIIYYDDKFADDANYIHDILLKAGNTFSPRLSLFVLRGNSPNPDADIEIWPGYFR